MIILHPGTQSQRGRDWFRWLFLLQKGWFLGSSRGNFQGCTTLMVQKSCQHQLSWVIFYTFFIPWFTTDFFYIPGGCLGFLNHHSITHFHHNQKTSSISRNNWSRKTNRFCFSGSIGLMICQRASEVVSYASLRKTLPKKNQLHGMFWAKVDFEVYWYLIFQWLHSQGLT